MIFNKNHNIIKRRIDHIVYAVADLEKAMNEFEEKLGVRPIFGGFHNTQGTKNALLNLTNACYLELLAEDENNLNIAPPRWMGIDILEKDQTTRFALKSDDLNSDSAILKDYNTTMGHITGGSRNTATGSLLQWKLIMPLGTPEVELAPFMVDWSMSKIHPSDFLPDMGCELIEIYGKHPNPSQFKSLFNTLGYNLRIEKANEVALKVVLQTPNGKVVI